MAEDWTPPTEVEEYRLLRLLGRGGMGSVWLAEDRLLARTVAIKWIAHAEPTQRARERFAREARAAARLQHVNVVTVHRYGETAGRPYLVSEYIRGESLDRLAKPVPWERALELGRSLARGLAAAHRHGIVHRDLKPANAILADDGEVKLVDFGLAYLDDELDGSSAPSPRVSGTPAYLAPEVRRGEPATRASDVYQLGGILYELVIGRMPIADVTGNATQTDDAETRSLTELERSAAHAIPSVRERLPARATQLAAIIDRCLQVEPGARYASGEALFEALDRLGPTSGAPVVFEGNPYRGLMPFEAEHRAVFFGRARETRAVVERLRSDAFVLVAGDSGVGKSSLCRAAVLPAIAEEGASGRGRPTVVTMVPGARPMATLVATLAAALAIDEAALTAVCDQPAGFLRELRRAAAGGLVVFVDQLEELVVIAQPAEARMFAAVLADLALGAPGLRLLASVRGDFLTRVAELPGLGPEIARAIYLLPSISAAGAREAVIGPARATGVRFESDALVDELVSAVTDSARDRSGAALPLLAFTLAELWDHRDRATAVITAGSLASIGGVRGALAAHGDGVLARLLPDPRRAAQRILLRLVTAGNTRARRTVAELGGSNDSHQQALSALVDGRLVVARGSGDDVTYELAHEGLLEGWPALAAMVSETTHLRALHERLANAVADWERMDRSVEGLWSARQLAEIAAIPADELAPVEARFLRASRRALVRRRWRRGAALALVPLTAAVVYGFVAWTAHRELEARKAAKVQEAGRLLGAARELAAAHAEERERVLQVFAAGDFARAEPQWAQVRRESDEVSAALARAARVLEAGFLLDTSDGDVRRRLAELTYERLELAERDYRLAERAELAARLELYDPAGTLMSRRARPGDLVLALEPGDATTVIVSGAGAGSTPLSATTRLVPGTYVLEARAPGRATVRWPVRLAAGEARRIAFTLPLATHVPPGMVFVPPARFPFGSGDDEPMRAFLTTFPMYEVTTDAFLIGAHEVTYAEWIEFLEQLPDDERRRRSPHLESSSTIQVDAALLLTRTADGAYELQYAPASVRYRARAGEPIVYRERTTRGAQDWRRFPVSGVSAEDAFAFVAWLDRTGKVPRARLCDEREWELAARGVDGRAFPHGAVLGPDDANVDVTYGKREGGYGFDEVGAHPASHSAFGLADTSGNAWELTRAVSGDGFVMKGGCYYQSARTAHLANRTEVPAAFRHPHVGFRVCADLPH